MVRNYERVQPQEKTCELCGAQYGSLKSNQKYCSERCRETVKRRRKAAHKAARQKQIATEAHELFLHTL